MRTSLFVLAATCVLAIHGSAAAQPASGKQVVTLPGSTPSTMLSAGVRVGDLLFASGQLGLKRDAPDSTIEGQTRQALENTKAVLEAGGTSMANVVKCTVFLISAADFAAMNRVYREFFPKDPPARSTVVVAALVVPIAKVEIECIAAIPR